MYLKLAYNYFFLYLNCAYELIKFLSIRLFIYLSTHGLIKGASWIDDEICGNIKLQKNNDDATQAIWSDINFRPINPYL